MIEWITIINDYWFTVFLHWNKYAWIITRTISAVTSYKLWSRPYSIIIWPVIWAFSEDNTYLGYCFPRLEVLTGRKWVAVVVVSFFALLQHIFMPFELDWRYLAVRFLSFLPFVIVYCLLYLRQRRLLPIHVLHWASNMISPLLALLMATSGWEHLTFQSKQLASCPCLSS